MTTKIDIGVSALLVYFSHYCRYVIRIYLIVSACYKLNEIQQMVIRFFLTLDDASLLSRAHFPPGGIGSHSHGVHRGRV